MPKAAERRIGGVYTMSDERKNPPAEEREKKERHPLFALWLTLMLLMLALGIALLVRGLLLGPNRVMLGKGTMGSVRLPFGALRAMGLSCFLR